MNEDVICALCGKEIVGFEGIEVRSSDGQPIHSGGNCPVDADEDDSTTSAD